ncbi:MAG: hypothetical protein PHU78_02620 [Heliobacteriaceae bacterium]|nr:hypothetical protein [Heliobacteriaceae bacterium]
MTKHYRFRLFILLGILPACILLWAGNAGILLPLCYYESDKTLVEDIDGDRFPESYLLKDKTLVITENGITLWTSPGDWKVQTILLADVNHDEQKDLVMVVWKRGSFGRDKPFWLSHEDRRYSSHLFLYNLFNDQLKPIWMSSALSRPIYSLQVQDVDNDGKNELITYEGTYSLLSCLTKSQAHPDYTVWKWKGWGFFRLTE